MPLHWDYKTFIWEILLRTFPKFGDEEVVMVSVRGTWHVLLKTGAEHSHKAQAHILQMSGGYVGRKGLAERWQHSGYGGGAVLAAGSPSVPVQQELESGASCCSLAGGHDCDNNDGRVCQGRSCHLAVCTVPPLSHPPLISAELELWDPFNTVVSGKGGKLWCNGLEFSMGQERWDSDIISGITDGSFKKIGGHWHGELSGVPSLREALYFVSVCSLLKPSRCQSASALQKSRPTAAIPLLDLALWSGLLLVWFTFSRDCKTHLGRRWTSMCWIMCLTTWQWQ